MDARLGALGLVAITEDPPAADALPGRAAALARRAGPRRLLVQVRAKALEAAALTALTRALIAAVRPHGALVLVNARLDVALAADADGVHLPEAGLPIAAARALAPRLLIGCSRHDAARAADAVAAGADLVHLGPIWSTPSKAGLGEPLGVGALARARQLVGERACLVAVGGLDAARAGEARRAGAHAVAAIRAAWGGVAGEEDSLRALLGAARQ